MCLSRFLDLSLEVSLSRSLAALVFRSHSCIQRFADSSPKSSRGVPPDSSGFMTQSLALNVSQHSKFENNTSAPFSFFTPMCTCVSFASASSAHASDLCHGKARALFASCALSASPKPPMMLRSSEPVMMAMATQARA